MRAMAHYVAGIAAVAGNVAAVLVAAHLFKVWGHVEHDVAQVGVLVVDSRIDDGDNAIGVGGRRVVPAIQVHVVAVRIAAIGRALTRGIRPLIGASIGKLIIAGDGGRNGHHAACRVVCERIIIAGTRCAKVARTAGRLGAIISITAPIGDRGDCSVAFGGDRGSLGSCSFIALVSQGHRAVRLGPQHPLIARERLQDFPSGHPLLLNQQGIYLDVGSLHGRNLAGLRGSSQLRARKRRIGKSLAECRFIGIARRLRKLFGLSGIKKRSSRGLLARNGIIAIGLGRCNSCLGGGRHDDDCLALDIGAFRKHGIYLTYPRLLLVGFFRKRFGNRRLAATQSTSGQRERCSVEQHRNGQQRSNRGRGNSLRRCSPGTYAVLHEAPKKDSVFALFSGEAPGNATTAKPQWKPSTRAGGANKKRFQPLLPRLGNAFRPTWAKGTGRTTGVRCKPSPPLCRSGMLAQVTENRT